MKTKNLLKSIITLLLITTFYINSNGQSWGLYTLYAPVNNTQTYLVDTLGVTFKTWTSSSSQKTGFSVYLIPGDTLVRPVAKSGNSFNGGAITGEVQKVTWDGTVAWDYTHSSSTYCLHHDIHPMPNGNVLMTAYESKSSSEATNAGCSQSMTIWSEKLIEVKPTGPTSGTIVWEWHLWDHLCQDYNSSKPNYVSSISEHPELMNINYKTSKDWIHMNGIDYNEALDQITFSSRTMDEIYIIDHSTSTAEAASHSGGNSGKGGDFLYRWGNPAAYSVSGTAANWDVVHDAHWISSDNANYPDYICGFNNGGTGGPGAKSTIDIILPPYDGFNYSYTVGQAMLPTTYAYRYTSSYNSNSNGASQQLPNGNMLICMSTSGYIYEITPDGTTLWNKTISGQPANALRYDECYVRGPIASAGISLEEICEGEQITLSSSAVSVTETNPTYAYNWESTATGFTSTSQNPTDNPITSTTYIVTISNTELGCSDTDSISIIVNALPEIPTISQNGNQLSSTSANSYQWYFDGDIISGATNQIFDAIANGNYQVEITDANGCTQISEPYPFINTDISQIKNEASPSIYPNPSSGIIKIENSQLNKVILRNSLGSVLETDKNVNIMDLSGYTNGIYYISIISEDGSVNNQKIILLK